ncbi:uncharacterized protein [Oscarella lobularis]|uniref:uncharacterized protein isoform X2 n=1 Tax=Oscarella lobularis TaxID=121494 RepID=UPI0033144DC9
MRPGRLALVLLLPLLQLDGALVVALPHPAASLPPRPIFPNTFTAMFHMIHNSTNSSRDGSGEWKVDYAGNKSIETYEIHNGFMDLHPIRTMFLARYDLGKEYFENNEMNSSCLMTTVNGTLPPPWTFMSTATFKEEREYHRKQLQVWEAEIQHETIPKKVMSAISNVIEVGVFSHQPDVPVTMKILSDVESITYDITKFDSELPKKESFDVPKQCET